MLVDHVIVRVEGGKGGDGIASFRRERFVPKGGPDGGDGGRGGDVIFRVSPTTHALSEFATKKQFKAKAGEPGRGKKQTGKSAESLVLAVPPGTLVFERTNDGEALIADLATLGEELLIAQGGAGGLGNTHFASATNQAPREATPGKPGDKRQLRLELRLLADVGIIGLPNAGKSTLLARVSAARPKIANYAFTTLEPNLGVVDHRGHRFVAADIPGLIEGAATGKGLGHEFLRHVLRTRVLVHLIASDVPDLRAAYRTIRSELDEYGKGLADRPEIVVVTKVELIPDKTQRRLWQELQSLNPIFLSAVTGRGVNDLLDRILELLSARDEPEEGKANER